MHAIGRHARLTRRLSLKEIADALASIGLKPLLRSARDWVSECLRRVEISLPLALFDAGQMEIFVPASGGFALLLKMEYDRETIGVHVLDALFVGEAATAEVQNRVSQSLNLNLKDHSWFEATTIKLLRQRFGELSPNGKRLADPAYRQSVRRFYDDGIRRKEKPNDGTWLESFAGDLLQQRTAATWIGQMVGQDEFDALTILPIKRLLSSARTRILVGTTFTLLWRRRRTWMLVSSSF